MLDMSVPGNAFTLRRCLPFNQIFHDRCSSRVDFFYMGVLNALNVDPTQLHPNSWAYI